jgi:hypothetical protein
MALLRRRPAGALLDDDRPNMAAAIGRTVVEDVDIVRARLDQLDARMAVLEARFADADEASIVLPDQADVLDAQVRSARIAAEVHLVAIELRSELQRLRSDWTASDEAVDLIDRLAELTDLTADA